MDKATEELRNETRRLVASHIDDVFDGKALLEANDRISNARTWIEHDVKGPLGGISSQVVVALDVDGKVVPVTIAIYSDDRIADLLEQVLDEEQEQDELRKRLGWT